MFFDFKTNDMQKIEDTRLKLYKLLDSPHKSPLDLEVLELSQLLDELIVNYLKNNV